LSGESADEDQQYVNQSSAFWSFCRRAVTLPFPSHAFPRADGCDAFFPSTI
jgi:hypothetical protein